MLWKITPSELTYGMDCPCCYWLKSMNRDPLNGLRQEQARKFPGVFREIDRVEREYWQGRCSSEIGLPVGQMDTKQFRIKSKPIAIPGRRDQLFVSCEPDCIVRFRDGSFGLLDFKTSSAKSEYLQSYVKQLDACIYALENPQDRQSIAPFVSLGLLVYSPVKMLTGEVIHLQKTLVPFQRDDDRLLQLCDRILGWLESDAPPPRKDGCEWCAIRDKIAPGVQ